MYGRVWGSQDTSTTMLSAGTLFTRMSMTVASSTAEPTKRTPKVYSNPLMSLAIVGGFGLLLFLFSAGKALLDGLYRSEGREIVATVTWCGYTSSSTSATRSVRYTFTVPDGRSFRGSQTGYGGIVGEPILVVYLPSHPMFNRVAGAERQGQKWLPFLAAAGIFFMFAGARSYRMLRRQA